jgi:hypothetical protein
MSQTLGKIVLTNSTLNLTSLFHGGPALYSSSLLMRSSPGQWRKSYNSSPSETVHIFPSHTIKNNGHLKYTSYKSYTQNVFFQ